MVTLLVTVAGMKTFTSSSALKVKILWTAPLHWVTEAGIGCGSGTGHFPVSPFLQPRRSMWRGRQAPLSSGKPSVLAGITFIQEKRFLVFL